MRDLSIDVVDGSVLRMQLPDEPTFTKSLMLAELDDVEVELQSSYSGWGRAKANDTEICRGFEVTHTLGYLGGTLWAGVGAVPEFQTDGVPYERVPGTGELRKQRFVFVCWETDRHSVSSHHYGGEPDDLIALYTRLDFLSRQNGVVCAPKSGGTVALIGDAQVLLRIGDTAIIEVAPPAHPDLPPLPAHKGSRVAGGEAYSFEDTAGHHGGYLISGDTTLAMIHTMNGDEEKAIESLVLNARFDWSR